MTVGAALHPGFVEDRSDLQVGSRRLRLSCSPIPGSNVDYNDMNS